MSDFYKYQALGNDYIVIEPSAKWFKPEGETIRNICDRHFGVGSDGILYGPSIEKGNIKLRIFNPDGSEAEKSGNGLRIFAAHLFQMGHVISKKFEILTSGGMVAVEILDEHAEKIKINMGKARFEPASIPINHSEAWIDKPIHTSVGEFNFTCLSMGNPHCVFIPDKWSEGVIHQIGSEIEHYQLFPNRTNVQMMRIDDKHNITIRIWERGAGYTLASGSSSCAAAMTAYKLGLVSEEVMVHMPGGKIEIQMDTNLDIWMTGGVKKVFSGLLA